MAKTVPISVRLSQEDAAFIAGLEIENAVTPSDKVRHIIKDARKQNKRIVNYEGCLKIARETLKDLTQEIKEAELEEKKHSELVSIFNDWIAEAFAYMAAANNKINEGEMTLSEFEEGITERIFRLIELIFRMGVTSEAPCYDRKIITKAFAPLLELIEILNHRIEKEK